MTSSFGFLHFVVVKCSDISEEPSTSILKVRDLVQVDGEEIWMKKCVRYILQSEGI
jgi:hypothetical protein